jgi:4-hydroxyphenylpyruvate dioxygenase
MADAPLLSMDVLQWARHHRNFPGQGQFELVDFFVQVLLSGYAGPLSLEIFNDQFRETPNRRTAVDAMRSLLFLESEARTQLEQARAGAQGLAAATRLRARSIAPRCSIRRPRRDSRASPSSNSVRSTKRRRRSPHCSDSSASRTSGTIGPSRSGCSGRAPSSLSSTRSRARRHAHAFEAQGHSVGAIGLTTADPAAAASRAGALLSARHDSRLGAGQLVLPAIVAPGGTVIHFVPSIDGHRLDADFAPVPSQPDAPAACGLETIDHVAFALAPDQFDTWILFSRAVLGLERGESLELADPFGLVRTSGVANVERNVRLVLNVSLSQRTRTARQVSATGSSGSGVHHIAFGTRDIFATMRSLRAQGVRFVPIPANYYDDLRDRLDIDEDRVRALQALDIVYDRSSTGDYYHAYGEPFADRFFFEIVQRNAYDGYGAVNAPARMASQEQGRRAGAAQ